MSSISCILQCGEPSSEIPEAITSLESWEYVKKKAYLWRGLDRYGCIYDSVDWDNGPTGYYIHKICKLRIGTQKKLNEAKARQKKRKLQESHAQNVTISDDIQPNVSSMESDNALPFVPHADSLNAPQDDQPANPHDDPPATQNDDPPVTSHVAPLTDHTSTPIAKRLRKNYKEKIHDKTKCVWCFKPETWDSELRLLSYDSSWESFKSHTIHLEDERMKDRINCLIEFINDDPYSIKIRYHIQCWLKYVHKHQSVGNRIPDKQNFEKAEAHTAFFSHINAVIFEDHELRSLQSLLRDYINILSEHEIQNTSPKSSLIKDMLIKKYGDSVGFISRPQKNQSDLVFDRNGGDSYVEALSSIGISTEQLIHNVGKDIRVDVKSVKPLPWPPRIEELEDEEELSPLLLQLLSALQGMTKIDKPSPNTLSCLSTHTVHHQAAN